MKLNQTESYYKLIFCYTKKRCKVVMIILCILSVNFTFAQEYKSRSYFSIGLYSLDTKNSANGLNILKDSDEDGVLYRLIDGVDLGFGYEFRIKNELGIRTGVDLFLSSFSGSHSENFQRLAFLEVPVSSITLSIAPRYYFLYDSDNGFFIETSTKLGFSTSKAIFSLMDKEDFSISKERSNIQFQYGFLFGYRLGPNIDLGESSTYDISLGVISQNLGASINKLDLKQSEFFENETFKRTVSLVLKLAINFSLKNNDRRN